MKKDNRETSRDIPFTALGLIFGTALGAALCAILSVSIFFAGIGTAAGLILGAAIDGYKRRK